MAKWHLAKLLADDSKFHDIQETGTRDHVFTHSHPCTHSLCPITRIIMSCSMIIEALFSLRVKRECLQLHEFIIKKRNKRRHSIIPGYTLSNICFILLLALQELMSILWTVLHSTPILVVLVTIFFTILFIISYMKFILSPDSHGPQSCCCYYCL